MYVFMYLLALFWKANLMPARSNLELVEILCHVGHSCHDYKSIHPIGALIRNATAAACAVEEKLPAWGSGGIEDDSLRISGQKDQHFK